MASNIANNISWTVLGEVAQINEANGDLIGVNNVVPNTGVGASLGDMLTWATQLLGRQFTNSFVAGRRVRGRIFLPGLTEDANTDGVPVAGLITGWQAAQQTLLSTLPNWVVWARPFPGDPASVPVKPARIGTKHLVTAVGVRPTWAILRSRRD